MNHRWCCFGQIIVEVNFRLRYDDRYVVEGAVQILKYDRFGVKLHVISILFGDWTVRINLWKPELFRKSKKVSHLGVSQVNHLTWKKYFSKSSQCLDLLKIVWLRNKSVLDPCNSRINKIFRTINSSYNRLNPVEIILKI